MMRVREVFLVALTMLLVVVFVYAVNTVFSPPYTDREIQASFVDTWQGEAIVTAFLLALLVPIAMMAVILGWRGSRLAKRLALMSAGLVVFAAVLLVSGHAALTERTTRLTGQDFGGFYGLF